MNKANSNILQLEEECGVTSTSLANARKLIKAKGLPVLIVCEGNTDEGDYGVKLIWRDGYAFTFTGFSWGYGGEGPAGLTQLLRYIGRPDMTADSVPIVDNITKALLSCKPTEDEIKQGYILLADGRRILMDEENHEFYRSLVADPVE